MVVERGNGMKPQEAINILEKYKSVPKSEVVKTAYEMAISALEKQIPTKGSIKYLSSYTDDPPVLLCPNCQEHIPTEGCNFFKYCYNCGQALDWGDTE